MAKRVVKTEHLAPHQFKSGQSGNPNGRPKMPEEIRKARKLNQIKVAQILNDFANMNDEEFVAMLADTNTSKLERMIASAVTKAQTGEFTALNFILDRMIGKVTDKVEHKLPRPTVIKLLGEDAVMVLGSGEAEEE